MKAKALCLMTKMKIKNGFMNEGMARLNHRAITKVCNFSFKESDSYRKKSPYYRVFSHFFAFFRFFLRGEGVGRFQLMRPDTSPCRTIPKMLGYFREDERLC
jgi:hypothetical protein